VNVAARFSHVAVCAHCRSTVVFGEDAAEVVGRMSVLPETRSPLFVGASGEIDGRRFDVLGRVRYGWARGYWDEWFIGWQTGERGWLSEDEGEVALEDVGRLERAELDWRSVGPGDVVSAAGTDWRVTERGTATCEGGEGQLPFVVQAGQALPFLDLEAGDRVGTLERSEDGETLLFYGRPLPWQAIRLDRTRADVGLPDDDLPVARKAPPGGVDRLVQRSGGVRTVRCRSCGGGMEVDTSEGVPSGVRCPYCGTAERLGPRDVECPSCQSAVTLRSGDEAQTATCGKCHTVLDVTSSVPRSLATLARRRERAPIELGTRFEWEGVSYEAVGVLRYDANDGSDRWSWTEVLLFDPLAGYLWFDTEDGHCALGRRVQGGPAVGRPAQAPDTIEFSGRTYRKAPGVTRARVAYVEGELPWVARVGDESVLVEYSAPPYGLSGEWSDAELEWFESKYLPRREVDRRSKGPVHLPRPTGVGFQQEFSPLALAAMKVSAAFALLAAVAAAGASVTGGIVAVEDVLPAVYDEDDGFVSAAFDVDRPGVCDIRLEAGVQNAWVYVMGALVSESSGAAIHEFSSQLSQYSGTDGGERWVEDQSADDVLVVLDEPGTYRVALLAEAGRGESDQADDSFQPPLRLTVRQGVVLVRYFAMMAGALFLVAIALFVAWRSFEKKRLGLEDDDD
jgi:hypothetical protein